jgi:Lrp/AsnC family leucine-responsive transcriptional regulator
MNLHVDKLLDRIGRHILAVLQENARLPLSRIGEIVGLSAPAVAERVKKLEEAGIIRGYHARIDPVVAGQPVCAFIHLTTETRHYPAVKALAVESPKIVACHHVSGDVSFIVQVHAEDVSALESLVARLSRFGQTRSTIVLSTPVDKTHTVPVGLNRSLQHIQHTDIS